MAWHRIPCALCPRRSLSTLLDGLNADDSQAPIHIHIAEQTKEVDDCIVTLRSAPGWIALARQRVDSRWCLVHATHMTDTEYADLARSGATAGLCLTTEANLGRPFVRCPPVPGGQRPLGDWL